MVCINDFSIMRNYYKVLNMSENALSRKVSGLIYLVYVVAAFFFMESKGDILAVILSLGGALVFIWYGDAIGEGCSWAGFLPITKPTPGPVVALFGWIMFSILAVLLAHNWLSK